MTVGKAKDVFCISESGWIEPEFANTDDCEDTDEIKPDGKKVEDEPRSSDKLLCPTDDIIPERPKGYGEVEVEREKESIVERDANIEDALKAGELKWDERLDVVLGRGTDEVLNCELKVFFSDIDILELGIAEDEETLVGLRLDVITFLREETEVNRETCKADSADLEDKREELF